MNQTAPQTLTLGQALQLAIQCHQRNNFATAEELYQNILQADPEQPDAMHLLGVLRDEQGRVKEAIELITKAISLAPDNSEMYNNLSIALRKDGQLDGAIEAGKKAVALDSTYAEPFYNLGGIYRSQNRQDLAEEAFRNAIRIHPGYSEAHYNLGNVLRDQGNLEAARDCYENAVAIRPDFYDGHNNMGVMLHALHDLPGAIKHFRAAVQIKPDFAEAWSNLAKALVEDKQEDEALLCYRRATALLNPSSADAREDLAESLRSQGKTSEAFIEFQRSMVLRDPNNPQVHINLGDALGSNHQYEDAIACFRRAIELNPNLAIAHNNLGVMLYKSGQWEEGMQEYEKAHALQPNYPDALINLSLAYEDHGELEKATKNYKLLLALRPNPCIELHMATMLNPIPKNRKEIEERRAYFHRELDALAKKELKIEDPYFQMGQTNFYIAYQGENDREIQQKVANIFRKGCPSLEWEAPHIKEYGKTERPKKLRIGIISAFFHEHTIARFTAGIVKYLPREECEVVLFRVPDKNDPTAEAMEASADKAIRLVKHTARAREQIAAEKLDVLFYADIGMDTFTYFLAFSRLAPVQCVTWGHPDTTGIPNVDYFISSKLLEPEGAQEHYSERLVLLEDMPTHYFRPSRSKNKALRSYYGLPENATLYVCPQNLFKFHPDFDPSICEILRRDPKGVLVLIQGLYSHWNETILERYKAIYPGVAGRVHFLPRVTRPDFLNLLVLADVMLDPPFFGGGNTSYEAFAMDTPIVTWPGPFMRGRVTYASYKKMGMTELVAHTPEEYVDIAHRLAVDLPWKAAMKEKIRALAPVLYDTKPVLDEMVRFFRDATDAAREGRKLEGWS